VIYGGKEAMSPERIRSVSRRRFLQFLAASPLFAQDALFA
jgi:hypothetical protein